MEEDKDLQSEHLTKGFQSHINGGKNAALTHNQIDFDAPIDAVELEKIMAMYGENFSDDLEDNLQEGPKNKERLPLSAKNFELRSEEVKDILTRIPSWTIRWGTAVIFGAILLILFSSWFIKYPDVVEGEVMITTMIPPEKLISKNGGRIDALLVKDKSFIKANTTIAVLESSASYKDVFLLKKIVDGYNIEEKITAFPFEFFKNTQLGEIESAYAVFQKDYIANQLNEDLHPHGVDSLANNLENDLILERLRMLEQQRGNNEMELQLHKNDFKRVETLYKKGIIAAQEFDNKKLSYIQAQNNYKNLLSSISQLKSSVISSTRTIQTTQINSTKENVNLERTEIQSFYQLKKTIKDWELNYTIKSSIAGRVAFMQIWNKYQSITAGENSFCVIPMPAKDYIAKVKVKAPNSGKIKEGQQVNISLSNFPDKEFGILTGEIKEISLLVNKEGFLLIDVSLPNGLESSYKKTIPFQQEMAGNAKIITDDLRLSDRIFAQLRSQVDPKNK
jgi:multidrug efflux pump subunit AcrA (membrane-fusion protein)